jgi:lipid-binding SYLF domain-containing protein
MKKSSIWATVTLAVLLGGCATAPERVEGKAVLSAEVREAIAEFKAADPGIERFFTDSEGYAVLPKIGKGAFIVGGAYGQGEVYQKNVLVGYCSLSQAFVGASLGGQSIREILFFRTRADIEQFVTGEFTLSAQATAVAMDAGAAAKADYRDGIAVFVLSDKGLMVDASVGGQKFKYLPKQ